MANTQGGSTDWIIASSAVDDSGKGTVTWMSPGAVTADDGNEASASVSSTNESHWLRSSHDFANLLPINAIITGVEVRAQCSGVAGSVERVIEVQLHNGVQFIGTAKTPNTTIPDSATDLDFGASDDTWDAVLNLIQIGFCTLPIQFAIRVDSDGGLGRIVLVDAMWMKLHFGGSGGGGGGGGQNIWPRQQGGDDVVVIPGSAGDFLGQ